MFIEFSYSISPQNTYNENCFIEKEPINYENNQLRVIEPKYNVALPLNLLRRMGRAVRVGVGSALELIVKYNLKPQAIIFSSAVGGLEDCIKFLNQINDYSEGTLTPTNFVQSTPNAIAGSLALLTNNHSYNTTHTNGANSFLDALLDAKLLMNEGKVKSCIVAGVEEISSYNYNINYLSGFYKESEISSLELFKHKSKGSICGEGSNIFYLTTQSNNYEAEIVAFNSIQKKLNHFEITSKIDEFFKINQIDENLITDLILGYNGDVDNDRIYDEISFKYNNSNIYAYKHLVGEYPISVSFGLWMGVKLFQNKEIPKSKLRSSNNNRNLIFIYNHYNKIEHSFLLIRK